MRFSLIISRYLIGAVLPYFLSGWLLLSVILFVQQAGRFSDIFFSANIPSNLIWQLSIALIPSVIAFTCPMAALVGIVIGLSKMQSDSELTAIRAAGYGNLQIVAPLAVFGILLSFIALAVNLYGVPLAASIVRRVAVQSAIYKLESPIEPGVFNTEIAGYTIYVKDGDLADGEWKNIFVFNEDEKAGTLRLVTSKRGRIDSTGQTSELVLENAIVSTFIRDTAGREKYVSENIGEFRIGVKTRRGELIERLTTAEAAPDELGLAQLSSFSRSKSGPERIEAEIVWQRRLMLSIAPFIFSLLATAMVLRFTGRGRAFGLFSALIVLIGYYLLTFLGEQLARTEKLNVQAAGFMPIAASALVIAWFAFAGRAGVLRGMPERIYRKIAHHLPKLRAPRRRNFLSGLSFGFRDIDILIDLVRYLGLTLGFLTAIFVIFTAFELWKFAGTSDGGIYLLLRYLLYLLPFVYLQLAPSAAMLATLATYVTKSRRNEIVTWVSAGQSAYRLILPCLVFLGFFGILNWQVQEFITPSSNQVQDELRARLRSRNSGVGTKPKYWVADERAIYSFRLASDNETGYNVSSISSAALLNISVFLFADNSGTLQYLYRSDSAVWSNGKLTLGANATLRRVVNGNVSLTPAAGTEIMQSPDILGRLRSKPSQLSSSELRDRMASSDSDVEKRIFSVALERKYSTLVLPLVVGLFTAPFAFSLSRKGKSATVAWSVGLWLVFMAAMSAFEQAGAAGFISARIAVWSPIALFAMLGVFMVSRVKT